MRETHELAPRFGMMVLPRPMLWLLHRWFLVKRGMTLGVRAVVLDEADRVLLVRHTYTRGWHLPGGGVEIGETLVEALVKELREEVAVTLTVPAILHGVFFNRRLGRRDHVAVFVVREFDIAQLQPSREIAEASFHPLSALPEDVSPATRRRLSEIVDEAPVSAHW